MVVSKTGTLLHDIVKKHFKILGFWIIQKHVFEFIHKLLCDLPRKLFFKNLTDFILRR